MHNIVNGCETNVKRFRQPGGYFGEQAPVHLALREMAVRLLPQCEADDGPLTAARIRQIKKRVPQGKKRSARSSLFKVEPA